MNGTSLGVVDVAIAVAVAPPPSIIVLFYCLLLYIHQSFSTTLYSTSGVDIEL